MTQPPADNDDARAQGHYFSPAPASTGRRTEYTFGFDGHTITMHGAGGVFSSHGLDKATAVLLDWIAQNPGDPPAPGSHLLDLGCGSGPLATAMAVRHRDCTVHAVDVNERALELCADNARANRIDNIVVSRPDQVDDAIRFGVIWSNPPIRIGKEALQGLLTTWLARLAPGGHALLVVSKNLGSDSLSAWLTHAGHRVDKMASKRGFRVLRVTSPTGVAQ